jgi:lysophospholipase L1-like esterase
VSPSPSPARLLRVALPGCGALVACGTALLIWACSSPSTSRQGDRKGGPPPGPGAVAGQPKSPPKRTLPQVDPCAAAVRNGKATRVDPSGKPTPLSPGIKVTHFAFATTTRGLTGRSLDNAEIWYLAHPLGACMEVFVDGKLRGRVSTRTLHPPPKRVQPRPRPRPKDKILKRVARLDLEATDTGRRRLARTAAGRYFEARRIRLKRGKHRVELRPVGRGTLRLFGVVMRRHRPGVVVHNLGVPGAQVANVSPGHKALIRAQLKRLKPDLLVLMLGTNDAFDRGLTAKRFERRLTRLLARLRPKHAKPDCLILGAPDFGSKKWRTARRLRKQSVMVRKIQRKVAKAQGCVYWDIFSAMGGANSIGRLIRARPRLAYKDRVHLTRRGYRALGSLIHEELMRQYARYLKPRFKQLRLVVPHRSDEELRKEKEDRRNWPAGMGPTPFVDPRGKGLKRLFRRLVLVQRRARRSRLSIVVMGDSHTAGDSLAGEIRSQLQRAFGDGGHGYLHVGKPWSAYRHRDVRYSIHGPWKYYYILTWNKPKQPRDWLYGAGGVSSWITVPIPPKMPKRPMNRKPR